MLNLANNNIENIEGLQMCTKLNDLDVSCNKIEVLEGIESLLELTSLNVSHNALISLTGLKKNVALKTLIARGNKFVLSCPKRMCQRDQLLIDLPPRIAQIQQISNVPSLTSVDLSGNVVEDLNMAASTIRTLTNLVTLDMSENPVAKRNEYFFTILENKGISVSPVPNDRLELLSRFSSFHRK